MDNGIVITIVGAGLRSAFEARVPCGTTINGVFAACKAVNAGFNPSGLNVFVDGTVETNLDRTLSTCLAITFASSVKGA